MAKRFFYVCAGLFLLAGAYAMGARNAGAAGGAVDGFAVMVDPTDPEDREFYVLSTNGDLVHGSLKGSLHSTRPVSKIGSILPRRAR